MSIEQLPNEWKTTSVSAVTMLIRGVTYKKEQATNYKKDGYLPLIRANNIQKGKFDTSDLVFVPQTLVKGVQKIQTEDIVIAMSSGSKSVVGKSAYQPLPFECSFGAFCGLLRPVNYISSSFVAHFTKSSKYRNEISDLSVGANINNIKPSAFDLIKIPLPPLAEQKIIADKLDDLLARVESIKTRLENIPEILKKFRQSVLSSNIIKHSSDKNSKDRFSTSLGSISEDIRYGTSKKCSETEGDTAVLRIPNIGSGHIIDSNLKYAYFDEKELSTLSLKKGDLLLIRSNGSVDLVGKVAMVSEKDTGFLYAGYLIRIRLNLEMAVPEYVTYCLQSPQIRQVIENIARSTSGVNNINSKELSSLILPIPSLEEQNEIIKDVDKYLSCISVFETMTDNALSRINNLTQSILVKAFRGELTALWREENSELISGINSAEALLEKITAEKLAAGTIKKRAKKSSH